MLSLLVFMFKVKISEKMHDDIVKQLEAKLAAGEIESDDESSADVEDAPAEAAGSGAAASGSAA